MSTVNPQNILSKTVNYKLSSSYPSMRPLTSSDNWKNGLFSFNNKKLYPTDNSVLTKSWGNYENKLANGDLNSDLTSLSWLEKRRLIDIEPLDMEDEKDNSGKTPGEDDVLNTNLSHAKVEVGSQENVHDFVRYAEMRNSANRYRSTGNVYDQPYQHSANGYVKPNLSYTQLIFLAIETCRDRAMTVNDIYQWCEVNYPYYKYIGPSWKNSLRHNLSINKSFKRMPREGQNCGSAISTSSGDELIDTGPPPLQPTSNNITTTSVVTNNNSNAAGTTTNTNPPNNTSLLSSINSSCNKGGPGRGAYWIVDDKERPTLLESIYRTYQQVQQQNHYNGNGVGQGNNCTTLPVLSDRSNSGNNNLPGNPESVVSGSGGVGKTTVSPISPELALLLRAAGLTTTSTQFGDAELSHLNSSSTNNPSANNGVVRLQNGSDENKNQDINSRGVLNPNDPDVALSASYNSTVSKLDGYCPSADSPGQSRHEMIDGDNVAVPRVKNRRKSKHEKIRSIAEIEKLLQQKSSSQFTRQSAPVLDDSHAPVSSNSSSSDNNMSFHGNSPDSPNHNSATTATTTTVNVVVAPHFDHMYARYQHFLPPAIPSDMDKKAYKRCQGNDGDGDYNDDDYGDNGEGLGEEYEDDDEYDDDGEGGSLDEEFLNRRRRRKFEEQNEELDEEVEGGDLGCSYATTIKTEKMDPSEEVDLLNSSCDSAGKLLEVHKKEPVVRNGYESDATLPMVTNGRSSSNASSLSSRKRRRKPIKTTKLVSTTSASLITALSSSQTSATTAATTNDESQSKNDKNTINESNNKGNNATNATNANNTTNALALNRSKRKRFKTTRIDDQSEQAAVEFLANQLQQKSSVMKNIDNLYQFLDDIQLTTTLSTSSTNSNTKPASRSATSSKTNKKSRKNINTQSTKQVLTHNT